MRFSIGCLFWLLSTTGVDGLQMSLTGESRHTSSSAVPCSSTTNALSSRRATLGWIAKASIGAAMSVGTLPTPAWGAAAVQDSVNVDSFLRTGVDIGGNMGVSSQAGKSKPVTGVFLRCVEQCETQPALGILSTIYHLKQVLCS